MFNYCCYNQYFLRESPLKLKMLSQQWCLWLPTYTIYVFLLVLLVLLLLQYQSCSHTTHSQYCGTVFISERSDCRIKNLLFQLYHIIEVHPWKENMKNERSTYQLSSVSHGQLLSLHVNRSTSVTTVQTPSADEDCVIWLKARKKLVNGILLKSKN